MREDITYVTSSHFDWEVVHYTINVLLSLVLDTSGKMTKYDPKYLVQHWACLKFVIENDPQFCDGEYGNGINKHIVHCDLIK